MAEDLVFYAGVYQSVETALTDLDGIQALHEDELIGKFDAAVIDQENGKPHIAKRVDRPRFRVIPELLGGGALPRRELKEAAAELTSEEAGLVIVGEPTIEKGIDKAITGAAKIVKHSMNATTDEIASELKEALKA
jgi:hypothetical protein